MIDLRIRVKVDLHQVSKFVLALIWLYLNH